MALQDNLCDPRAFGGLIALLYLFVLQGTMQ